MNQPASAYFAQMPEYLFSNFLESQEAYNGAVDFWTRLLRECLDPEQQDSWLPWFGLAADGNPIFSVVNRQSRKGISIHQEHLLDTEPFLACTTRVFDECATVEGPIEHLLIICELSTAIVPEAKRLILQFLE